MSETKMHTWRESVNFAQRPPFDDRPGHACPRARCVLEPVQDGDWPSRGHLWVFQGRKCRRRKYVDQTGRIVPSPGRYVGDRVPGEVCAKCGRRRAVGRKWSVRLGCDVFSRYCRRQKSDAANLQHDPPSHYVERGGRMVLLSVEQIEKLRGRSKRSFAVPKCELRGCPRLGKSMERSAVLRLKVVDGADVRIATYRCRAPKNHAVYRVLPAGEIAERVGFGRYRWAEAGTAKERETANRKRPIRRGRQMPDACCPEHGNKLRRFSGPWPVRGGRRRWRARCASGGEFLYVRGDGAVEGLKDSRWRRTKGGPKPGPRPTTRRRIEWAAAFSACGFSQRKMAPFVAPDKPKEAASYIRSFFSEWRAEIRAAKSGLPEEQAQAIVKEVQTMTLAARVAKLQSVGNSPK